MLLANDWSYARIAVKYNQWYRERVGWLLLLACVTITGGRNMRLPDLRLLLRCCRHMRGPQNFLGDPVSSVNRLRCSRYLSLNLSL